MTIIRKKKKRMQALPVLAGKEGDQRRCVCAERLGDLEQEKTEERILGAGQKKPVPWTKKAHRAAKGAFYRGIAQKGLPVKSFRTILLWGQNTWVWSTTLLLMVAWGPQSSVPPLWDRAGQKVRQKSGLGSDMVQTMCYKLWELCWIWSPSPLSFFVSSGESKNESQHPSLHLHDKYIALILTLKKEKKDGRVVSFVKIKFILSVVQREIFKVFRFCLWSQINLISSPSIRRPFGIWHFLKFQFYCC